MTYEDAPLFSTVACATRFDSYRNRTRAARVWLDLIQYRSQNWSENLCHFFTVQHAEMCDSRINRWTTISSEYWTVKNLSFSFLYKKANSSGSCIFHTVLWNCIPKISFQSISRDFYINERKKRRVCKWTDSFLRDEHKNFTLSFNIIWFVDNLYQFGFIAHIKYEHKHFIYYNYFYISYIYISTMR